MTPAHFIRILEVPEAERRTYDLSSLRLIIHGGAPCPVAGEAAHHRRAARRRGVGVVRRQRGRRDRACRRRSGSRAPARRPARGPASRSGCRRIDGAPCPPGNAGVIYIQPPGGDGIRSTTTATTTRPRQRGATARSPSATSATLDDDGYLYITDRVSDMVIRDGVNVYPREIEDVLFRHPAVVDCAVFGVPDERHGEVLQAVVETAPPVTAEGLSAFVREQLADYKCPAAFTLRRRAAPRPQRQGDEAPPARGGDHRRRVERRPVGDAEETALPLVAGTSSASCIQVPGRRCSGGTSRVSNGSSDSGRWDALPQHDLAVVPGAERAARTRRRVRGCCARPPPLSPASRRRACLPSPGRPRAGRDAATRCLHEQRADGAVRLRLDRHGVEVDGAERGPRQGREQLGRRPVRAARTRCVPQPRRGRRRRRTSPARSMRPRRRSR